MTTHKYKVETDECGPVRAKGEKAKKVLPRMHVKLGEEQVNGLRLGDEIEITLMGTIKSLEGEDRWDGPGLQLELKQSSTKSRGEDQDQIDSMLGE